MLDFARLCERVEADQHLVDKARMAHDDAAFRQSIQEIAHQRTIVYPAGIVVGAGEARVDLESGARGAALELGGEVVEEQRLRRGEPLAERLVAAGLTHP